jgi:dTMP kinase
VAQQQSGFFITFEGIEGAGKSTLAQALHDQLQKDGWPVKLTREPGGTSAGEQIRNILANPDNTDITPLTEVLLLSASRSQLVEQFIRPQLGEGNIVICDRFFDSTMAYQGYGRRVHLREIRELADMCTWGVKPHLTLLIDIDPELGLGRVRTRSVETLTRMDRFENMDFGFHERVREGFLEIAQDEPQRFRILDGHLDLETLKQNIHRVVMKEVTRIIPHPGKLTFDRSNLE